MSLVGIGMGTHTSASGVVYSEEWCDDKMQGRGSLQHPSRTRYEGEFKDMYHSTGTYIFRTDQILKYIQSYLPEKLVFFLCVPFSSWSCSRLHLWSHSFSFNMFPCKKKQSIGFNGLQIYL
uniref:Uncharacterized protein n=1 Tax=Nothobranchius furzeri TaxID=105023 RepID=A0A8C6KLM2_NOTFU